MTLRLNGTSQLRCGTTTKEKTILLEFYKKRSINSKSDRNTMHSSITKLAVPQSLQTISDFHSASKVCNVMLKKPKISLRIELPNINMFKQNNKHTVQFYYIKHRFYSKAFAVKEKDRTLSSHLRNSNDLFTRPQFRFRSVLYVTHKRVINSSSTVKYKVQGRLCLQIGICLLNVVHIVTCVIYS